MVLMIDYQHKINTTVLPWITENEEETGLSKTICFFGKRVAKHRFRFGRDERSTTDRQNRASRQFRQLALR